MLLDEYMEKYEHKEKTRYGTADSRKEELEMAADALEDAAEVLKLVASGKVSQGKAAEMLCLGFKDFNDPNEYLGAFFSFVPKDIFYHALAVGRSPYENLIYDIFELPQNEVCILKAVDEEDFRKVMEENLTSEECDMLNLKYGLSRPHTMSYNKIGSIYKKTDSSVRREIIRSLRKLRTPELYLSIFPEHSEYIKSIEEFEQFKEQRKKMRESIKQAQELKAKVEQNIFDENEELEELLDNSIEFLHLSTRSYNCLRRNNINTVRDLVNTDMDSIMEFRNIGAKSFAEIRGTLKKYNLYLQNDFWRDISEERKDQEEIARYPEVDLSMNIAGLGISDRTNKILRRVKIKTVSDLCSQTEDILNCISGLTESRIKEIKERLYSFGLSLSEPKAA